MTTDNDTQDQRLTDAEREAINVAVVDHNAARAVMFASEVRWVCGCGQPLNPSDPGAAFGDLTSHQASEAVAAVERILAARSVRDDPTLRVATEVLTERLKEMEQAGGGIYTADFRAGFRHALAMMPDAFQVRAVLAEHAPADDPTRQAAAQALRDAADALLAVAHTPMTVSEVRTFLLVRADLITDGRLAATPEDGA